MIARLETLRARLGLGRSVGLVCLLAGTLLAVVALASRAYQPVAGDEPEREPSAEFFDWFFTAATILWLIGAVLFVFLYVGQARSDPRSLRIRIGLPGVVFLIAVVLLLTRADDLFGRFRGGDEDSTAQTGALRTATATANPKERRRSPEFEWPLAVAALAGAVIAAGVVGRRRLRRRHPADETLAQALAAALDDTLDDLRREGDPRRAVIAAYARMERLLGAHGIPRRPAEAPLEYLERVLVELEVGHAAASALTALFEEAKFSDHEVGTATRDDAVSALAEVRDELWAGR